MTLTARELHDRLGLKMGVELDALHLLAKILPPDPLVVNCGAGWGVSGLAFIEARQDLFLYSVDDRDANHPRGALGNERDVFVEAGISTARYKQIHADVEDAGKRLMRGKMVHMVYHDADHHGPKVKDAVNAWAPNVLRGGIFAFHDYGDPRWTEVKPVVDERLGHWERILWVGRVAAFKHA